MDRSAQERRRPRSNVVRKTFGELSREVIRRRVRETVAYTTHWVAVPNLAWARWERDDGRLIYCALRRRVDWITGELGVASEPVELDDLTLVTSPGEGTCDGCRIQMGYLIHGHDRWWSSGGSEQSLVERIDWIALQMQLRIHAFVSATVNPNA